MSTLSPYQQTQLARYGNPAGISGAQLQQMPVEYATGRAEFCGLALHVSPRVLIPREETEELVELALQTVSEKLSHYTTREILRIAEVGTGSGAVSIVLAKHLSPFKDKLTIVACDVSPEALQIAKQNQAEFLSPSDVEVTFIASDLLKNFDTAVVSKSADKPAPSPQKFAVIIANLPYIPSQRIPSLDTSVKDYEPHLALDGGPRGLTLIYKLLDQSITHLQPNGVVLLEIDESHSIVDFREFGQYFEVEVLQDSFGKNRFARLVFKQQPYVV